MSKKLLFIFVFLTLTLTPHSAVADYTLTNGSTTETARVAYSVWQRSGRDANSNWWPEGWRTSGWYEIKPNETINLRVPAGNRWVYIRVERGAGEVKPANPATRDTFLFWIHPSEAFTAVETSEGVLRRSKPARLTLKQEPFYEYRNGGSHTIADEPRLPNLPAQQIYNAAIHSVVWIHTGDGRGSGVLIDKKRRLAVTNAHVTKPAEWVGVVFPYKQNGKIMKDREFYLRDNFRWLKNNGYITEARVIAENSRTDLAIIQLRSLPRTADEIKHDFNRNVEDSMKKGDTVHILGHPENLLWNWTRGAFERPFQVCWFADGTSVVGCLAMEADTHPGSSGGPVLNGQGILIGILFGGRDETASYAVPARNVKALLNTVPVNLGDLPPPRTYPKEVFRVRNPTGVNIPYQIRWSNADDWQRKTLQTGFIATHWSNGQHVPQGYPKIRFDHIAGDRQVTYRTYNLDTSRFREGNNDHAPTYFFRYNLRGDRLDLFRDAPAAPALSKAVPKENKLLANWPNPFNPETWIPYQLTQDSPVSVSIYETTGKLVRTLSLGFQSAGFYNSQGRAAYWDGRNDVGEPVASGVYFYTLTAGDFTATRKLLIKK